MKELNNADVRFGSKAAAQNRLNSSTRAAGFGVYRTLATPNIRGFEWLLSAISGHCELISIVHNSEARSHYICVRKLASLHIAAGFRNLADCGVFIAESFNRMAGPFR